MVVEHIEERRYTPAVSDKIPDVFAQLGVADIIAQRPDLSDTFAQLIQGFENLHTRDAAEWDRRALVLLYDRYILEILEFIEQLNGVRRDGCNGAVDET